MAEQWWLQAACRGVDPEVFFPSGVTGGACYTTARAICAGCPVKAECLQEAVEQEDVHRYGFRGGMTPDQRQAYVGGLRRDGWRPAPAAIVHGTNNGWRLHRKRGDMPCEECRRAHALYIQGVRPSRARVA